MTKEQVRARLIELGQEQPSDSLVDGWHNIVNGILPGWLQHGWLQHELERRQERMR